MATYIQQISRYPAIGKGPELRELLEEWAKTAPSRGFAHSCHSGGKRQALLSVLKIGFLCGNYSAANRITGSVISLATSLQVRWTIYSTLTYEE